ncbi:MAG: hypothetical protein SFU87_05120 [Chitinophagaceae bacterium]|nr:hypothetical protein [Chitinophagaceae bacterium]
MKYINYLLIAFFLFPSHILLSQEKENDKKKSEGLLSPKTFNYVFNKSFSKFATGQENSTPLSNFASFDPSNSRFLLNGFIPLKDSASKKPTFLSFKISGGLINGSATTLFSDKKLNTDVSIDLKYHFFFRPFSKQITYFTDEKYILKDKVEDIAKDSVKQKTKFDLSLNENWIQKQKESINWQIETVKIEYEKISRKYEEVKNKIIAFKKLTPILHDSVKYYSDSSASLLIKIAEKINERVNLSSRHDSLSAINERKERLTEEFKENLKKVSASKRLAAELEAKINSIRYSWLSVILSLNKRKYYTYYDSLPFKDRLQKNTLDAFNIGIEWNFFSQGILLKKAHYLNFGVVKRRFNNLDELSATDIEQEIKNISNDTTRKIVKKYSAFTDIVNDFRSWLIYSNYYFFFGKSLKTGIHLFPELELRVNQKNRINSGFGFIVALNDEKKEKNTLNIETYIKFLDITNQQQAKDKFYERLEIGIRVGLPIKPF